jgi:hypothetical protein
MKISAEVVEYLHDLRDSGEINMFGAAPYLIRDFGMARNQAREITMAYISGNFEIEE